MLNLVLENTVGYDSSYFFMDQRELNDDTDIL